MSEARVTNLSNESNSGGPTISGITTFSGANYFVPPVGNTAERPENAEPGSIRFNIDSKHLEYFKGDTLGWQEVEAINDELNGGHRGLFTGGYNPASPYENNIDQVTIPTLGNAVDFGNTLDPIKGQGCAGSRTRLAMWGGQSPGGYQDNVTYVTFASHGNATDTGDLVTACRNAALSNNIRGILGGTVPYTNVMEYSTIATLGDSLDFGDLTEVKGYVCTCASTTRGLWGGGLNNPTAEYNTIDYVTIMTTGNSTDFGDLTNGSAVYEMAGFSNATRGIMAGGYGPNYTDIINYMTIATLGNASDFGDLTNISGNGKYSCSSPVRGVLGGGYGPSPHYTNALDYIQIMTTGNSKEFGDLTSARRSLTDNGSSNGHGGL